MGQFFNITQSLPKATTASDLIAPSKARRIMQAERPCMGKNVMLFGKGSPPDRIALRVHDGDNKMAREIAPAENLRRAIAWVPASPS
jgi:hypothetical protein